MLRQVDSIEDLGRKVNMYVDCFVSTSADEVESILLQSGFRDATFDERKRETIYNESSVNFEIYGCVLEDQKTHLEIDCVDLSLDEALRKREVIGFMPMSQFRVYTNGSPKGDRILLPIMKALDKERQNMAFFDDSGLIAHVKLSEFYK